MRKVIEKQMKIGETSIADIEFDLSCRDEIPKLLIGLQSIWCDKETRDKVFQILEELVPDNVDPNNGRRGMDLWKILVLGTVRLGCDWDYDKLQDIANNHATLRLMLGHSFTDNDKRYALQTLKDNLRLFTPELLDKINTIAVAHGHKVLGLSSEEKIDASCDSYVVETDVHFPTDTNLLWDAIRKTIVLAMRLCDELGLSGWRLGKFNLRKIKRLFMRIQRMKHSASKDEKKKEERRQLIINTHLLFLQLAQSMVDKAQKTLDSVSTNDILTILKIEEIRKYIVHAERQIDQIRRRVVDGETIPHHEKVFSIFQEHTEWISKGKIGKSVELGLKSLHYQRSVWFDSFSSGDAK